MEFRIIYRPFPNEIKGLVGGGVEKESDDCYLILIDSDLSEQKQDFTLRHELAHIAMNHFDYTLPFDEVCKTGSFGEGWEQREKEADSIAEKMTVDELLSLWDHPILRSIRLSKDDLLKLNWLPESAGMIP